MNNDFEIIETIFYQGIEGAETVEVIVGDETLWASQKSLAQLFNIDRSVINKHLKNIFEEGELEENSTCAKIAQVQKEGNRKVKRSTKFYNLDAMIAVGYRVNSKKATRFRQWATKTLKEYMIKGFVLDDELLKNSTRFGKDYFDELLERIKEIRASERRFYQKVTDIFAECSYDYNKKSQIAKQFYACVQNKLHFAITGETAAELINTRSDHEKENMGLRTWKNSPNGKILRSDVQVAKNYLKKEEIDELNQLVNMYLDYAENQAKRHKLMLMNDWAKKLDSFLEFNEYGLLKNKGKIAMGKAKDKALKEYIEYAPIQDKLYISDFDELVENIHKKNN